jgi:hypothetical protein
MLAALGWGTLAAASLVIGAVIALMFHSPRPETFAPRPSCSSGRSSSGSPCSRRSPVMGCLGGHPRPTTRQISGGDRQLKSHDVRGNLASSWGRSRSAGRASMSRRAWGSTLPPHPYHMTLGGEMLARLWLEFRNPCDRSLAGRRRTGVWTHGL